MKKMTFLSRPFVKDHFLGPFFNKKIAGPCCCEDLNRNPMFGLPNSCKLCYAIVQSSSCSSRAKGFPVVVTMKNQYNPISSKSKSKI